MTVLEPVIKFDGARFLPLSLLARRHLVQQRVLLKVLRDAGVRIIYIGTHPQVFEADYQGWLEGKLREVTP